MTDPHQASSAGQAHDPVTIGLVSISDRASSGVYQDQGIPALQDWLGRALHNPITWVTRLIPDDQAGISATLRELVDAAHCHLVLTTGGTGPALRDVTPEVHGIFAAVPYCVDLIGGPYMDCNTAVCKAFRPKSAIRAPKD